jgi:ribosome-binding factor A
MASDTRAKRVAEAIKEEVASLLINGLKDTRIGFVSVVGAKVSSDLRSADVYVSLYGSESEKKSSLIGLQSSAGFVRRHIGKALRLRFAPEIRFREDTTLDEVFRLEKILKEIKNESAGQDQQKDGDEVH